MRSNVVRDKTFAFAIKIINVYKVLTESKHEFVLSKQMLRSGTSIGANVREGIEAQSKKDFISKLSIALKEAVETEYWLELLKATEYLDNETADIIRNELIEIIKLLNAIIKTSKESLNK